MPDLLDINSFHTLFRRTEKGLGVSGSDVFLSLDNIYEGKIRVLTHVTVEDFTSGFSKCRLGINHSGIYHYIDELENISASELCVSRSDILLGQGDTFFAELTGTTTGDELIMTCIGWEQIL